MRRYKSIFTPMVLIAAVVFTGQPIRPMDRQSLQGNWRLDAPDKLLGTLKITNLNYEYKVGNYIETGTINLDPANAINIDFRIRTGSNKNKVRQAIYQIVDSRLSLCTAEPGRPRPTEFKRNQTAGHILWTGWK